MPQRTGELPPFKKPKLASTTLPLASGSRRAMLLTTPGTKRHPSSASSSLSSSSSSIGIDSQRRNLPIFQARGTLLGQLRTLDCAVLIGEGIMPFPHPFSTDSLGEESTEASSLFRRGGGIERERSCLLQERGGVWRVFVPPPLLCGGRGFPVAAS